MCVKGKGKLSGFGCECMGVSVGSAIPRGVGDGVSECLTIKECEFESMSFSKV